MKRRVLSQMGEYDVHTQQGQMGAACQPGYYPLKIFGVDTGQCVPDSGTLANQAAGSAITSIATGVATSPATIQAGKTAVANSLGQKIMDFYTKKPAVAIGVTVALGALVVYGFMSFAKKAH